MSFVHINHEKFVISPLLSYIVKSQLDNDEVRLLLKPPCELYLPIEELITPRNNHKNPPRPQNCFMLYRKNYNKSSDSINDVIKVSKDAGKAWNNESGEVRKYFKILENMSLEKHKLIYPNYEYKTSGDQLLSYKAQKPGSEPGLQQRQNNNDRVTPSSSPPLSSYTSLPPFHSNINYKISPYTNNNTNPLSSMCLTPPPYFSTPSHSNINDKNSYYPQNNINEISQAARFNTITGSAIAPSQTNLSDSVFDPFLINNDKTQQDIEAQFDWNSYFTFNGGFS
nr:5040_t:CDS:2 [Entrophospora candida]